MSAAMIERGLLGAAHLPDPMGDLQVNCWCERRIVRVPAEDVRQGITATCGAAGCHGPAPHLALAASSSVVGDDKDECLDAVAVVSIERRSDAA